MVKAMKRQIRTARHAAARSSFVQGLGALLIIDHAPRRPRRKSAMEALRGDMEKLGMDMNRVMQREHVYEKTSRKAFSEPAE